jgi:hypothetical protein
VKILVRKVPYIGIGNDIFQFNPKSSDNKSKNTTWKMDLGCRSASAKLSDTLSQKQAECGGPFLDSQMLGRQK